MYVAADSTVNIWENIPATGVMVSEFMTIQYMTCSLGCDFLYFCLGSTSPVSQFLINFCL